jgi:hypothetical protein
VCLQERADKRAVAPVARDASTRGGRVVEEPGIQDSVAENVPVICLCAYELREKVGVE